MSSGALLEKYAVGGSLGSYGSGSGGVKKSMSFSNFGSVRSGESALQVTSKFNYHIQGLVRQVCVCRN
jgi:hypothetical protein